MREVVAGQLRDQSTDVKVGSKDAVLVQLDADRVLHHAEDLKATDAIGGLNPRDDDLVDQVVLLLRAPLDTNTEVGEGKRAAGLGPHPDLFGGVG